MNSTFSRFCIHRAESPIVAASGCPSTSFSPAPSAAVSRFRASKILRLGLRLASFAMDFLGLIPARGGSKGIPRKNLALLAGRPLLAYTCEAALGASGLGPILLSTDDEEIATVGRELGVEVPFLRPKSLAGEHTPMIEIMRHAVRWCEEHGKFEPDAVVLLQPTSPLRRREHIDRATERFSEGRADTLVTVVRVSPSVHTPVAHGVR